ncbi:YhcH/YjgK/YiaL family protein [Mucilaginibacter sp. RS28]|uniref:YhcH/YjgK/YiaL family protein n=1 Tax=Mucilaginibacter straminoryzae TaxID=2932774 RepID=A0A9X1X367_9SPHI|nr:YhcH/YjgK/YiaL family protein [Mucilaginibacter straminoryzae]MCJ8209185.1 YhcH/YjgK/YiaL family protein [Mucilaginibacter straminoryzae]
MKTKKVGKLALGIALALLTAGVVFAQPNTGNNKAAKKWVKSKAWGNGIKLNVFDEVNAAEFQKQYIANKAVWDKAFEFIKTHDLDTLHVGRYPIDGDNAYATITDSPTREFDQTKWESHQKYIDLQYVIRGAEKIGMVPVNTATVVKEYDPAKDVANYSADGKYYLATSGTFFLFFPQDAHRPNVKTEGADTDKKLVIKIKVAQ